MKYVGLSLLVCLSCTAPIRVNGFFEHEIGSVKDPEALADLRSIGEASACDTSGGSECDFATNDRSRGKAYADYSSYLSPHARLAACIVSVASYQSPTPGQLSDHMRAYEPFKTDPQDRNTELCNVCVQPSNMPGPPDLLPLENKYFARCSAEANDLLTRTFEAELQLDAAAARSARDVDSPLFGGELRYVESKLIRIDEIGRDPGFVAGMGADLRELRYGVYGPTAMRVAFDNDPAVAPARKELDRIELEQQNLSQHAKTEVDLARQRDLARRVDELHAAIALEEAKYSFAAVEVRVKAYESAPDTVRIKVRLSALKGELAQATERRDIARADALAAEQKQLEAQLAALRKHFEISWSIY